MNNNKLKEIYEAHPLDWIVYHRRKEHDYHKSIKGLPLDTQFLEYKLIAKSHCFIADAVIANPTVEVEVFNPHEGYETCKSFFEYYDSSDDYRLKETKPTISKTETVQNFSDDYRRGWKDRGKQSDLEDKTKPTQINSMEEELTYKKHKEAREKDNL